MVMFLPVIGSALSSVGVSSVLASGASLATGGVAAITGTIGAAKAISAAKAVKGLASVAKAVNLAGKAGALCKTANVVNAAVKAGQTAKTLQDIQDAAMICYAGYEIGKACERRSNQKAAEDAERNAMLEQQRTQEKAALEELRKQYPNASDAELRNLLMLITRLEQEAA